MRSATTRSSKSNTSANLLRISSETSPIHPSDDLAHGVGAVPPAPFQDLVEDPHRGPRIGKRSRPHLDGTRPSQQQLHGVSPSRHAPDAHDDGFRQRGVDIVDRAYRDRVDGRSAESPATRAEPRTA